MGGSCLIEILAHHAAPINRADNNLKDAAEAKTKGAILRAKSQEWWRQVLSWIPTIKKEFGYPQVAHPAFIVSLISSFGDEFCAASICSSWKEAVIVVVEPDRTGLGLACTSASSKPKLG